MDEQKKYEIIKALADHPDGNKDRAALTLGCTKRHINRMLKGYREQGKAFFIHGNRGRKPASTIPNDVRQSVIDLYRTKYYDANFQHFSELLATYEQIFISPSSVASILESAYILSPRATKTKKNVSGRNWKQKNQLPRQKRRPMTYRLISSPSRMPIPDAPDVPISANYSRWMPRPTNGSANSLHPFISQ